MIHQLEKILNHCRPLTQDGQPASYIPELYNVDKNKLGICLITTDGERYAAGDYTCKFTMQSISKICTFACVLLDNELQQIAKKVSLEPTSDGFNSIINLETKNENKPLNPMINSGAIACVSLVSGNTHEEKFNRVLRFIQKSANNHDITFNVAVYKSEKATGSRNRALAYYMKSTNIINDDVEALLDIYFRICSLEVTCEDLASIALTFAQDGVCPVTNEILFTRGIAKTVKATMSLCGMYDESGAVAVQVGLPSKSGVGGGILSVVPKKMGIGVFGPSLGEKGSSIAGLEVLKILSEQLDLSIY